MNFFIVCFPRVNLNRLTFQNVGRSCFTFRIFTLQRYELKGRLPRSGSQDSQHRDPAALTAGPGQRLPALHLCPQVLLLQAARAQQAPHGVEEDRRAPSTATPLHWPKEVSAWAPGKALLEPSLASRGRGEGDPLLPHMSVTMPVYTLEIQPRTGQQGPCPPGGHAGWGNGQQIGWLRKVCRVRWWRALWHIWMKNVPGRGNSNWQSLRQEQAWSAGGRPVWLGPCEHVRSERQWAQTMEGSVGPR